MHLLLSQGVLSAGVLQPTAEQIEELRRILKKTYSDQLAERERQIDDEHSEQWEIKDETLQGLLADEAKAVNEELAVPPSQMHTAVVRCVP